MSKLYVGVGHLYQRYPPPGYVEIWEEEPSGTELYVGVLVHGGEHPFAEFYWGEESPGSAALAQALLQDVTGREPEPWLYEQLLHDFVARWPMHPGECWRMRAEELLHWLSAQRSGERSQQIPIFHRPEHNPSP